MATSNPLAPDAETDIDNPEIHRHIVPLTDFDEDRETLEDDPPEDDADDELEPEDPEDQPIHKMHVR